MTSVDRTWPILSTPNSPLHWHVLTIALLYCTVNQSWSHHGCVATNNFFSRSTSQDFLTVNQFRCHVQKSFGSMTIAYFHSHLISCAKLEKMKHIYHAPELMLPNTDDHSRVETWLAVQQTNTWNTLQWSLWHTVVTMSINWSKDHKTVTMLKKVTAVL